MSQVNLEDECCDNLSMKFNINSTHPNTNSKCIVSHLDYLKIASDKVSGLEQMTTEQKWKYLHTFTQVLCIVLYLLNNNGIT
jgi:hypothetical protein